MQNNPTHKAKTFDGQWIEGWYDGSDEVHCIWTNENTNKLPDRINPTTLCRSTYRQDSNSKMMYEGDEVLVNNVPHTIIWDDGRCSFRMIDIHDLVVQFHPSYKYTLKGKNKYD
jgi:hypothetical protein